jgi:hypothetical protein
MFILGNNAKGNHVIIDQADPNDWWVHSEGMPSAHCIIEKDVVSENDLIYAANLIRPKHKNITDDTHKNKKQIKQIKQGDASVFIYTQIKHICKTKTPGQVKLKIKPHVLRLQI